MEEKQQYDSLNKNNDGEQDESLNDDPMSNSNDELNEINILGNTGGNIEINVTIFPDDVFRKTVKTFSLDGNLLTLEERSLFRELGFQQKNITSLKGIEYFTFINSLACSNNKLASTDFC